MSNTLSTHYPERPISNEVALQYGGSLGISHLKESGIRAVNEHLGVTQEAVAQVVAGSCDFVISKVITDTTEGYTVSVPSQDPEGRAHLIGFIAPGQSLNIGRSLQTGLEDFKYLSRNHFAISVNGVGDITVTDLGSSNGTVVRTAIDGEEAYEGLKWASSSSEVLEMANLSDTRSRIIRTAGHLAYEVDSVKQGDNIHPATLLSTRDIAGVIESSKEQSEYNRRVTQDFADVLPKNGIEIRGKKYAMGDIFKYHNRLMLIAFIENDEHNFVPRLFYKSHSDGGWRSCPGIHRDGTFSKGENLDDGAYVWGTKPAEAVIRTLEDIEAHTFVNGQPELSVEVDRLFNIDILKSNGLYNFEQVSQFIYVSGATRIRSPLYNSFEPGVGFKKGISSDVTRHLLENLVLPDGFEPDFNKLVRTYTFKHTILGESTVTVHKAVMGNQEIEWHVASSRDGTIWVDKIITIPESISNYGTYSTVIKAGALAAKPLDYAGQTEGMIAGLDYTDVNGSRYVSLRPTIDRMPWAKAYREARKIY